MAQPDMRRFSPEPARTSQPSFDVIYPRDGDTTMASLTLRLIYRPLDVHPEIDEFTHVPVQKREEDKRLERELGRRYRMDGTEAGMALEQFLVCELGRNEWFGGETTRTAAIDDYRGVDAVIEWDEEERFGIFPRLLVDFTTSVRPENVGVKLQKLTNGGNVDYYKSPFELDEDDEEKEMSLRNTPMVILGIDPSFLTRVAGMAMEHKKGQTRKDGYTAIDIERRTFEHYPLQVLLLEQAIAQVERQVFDMAARLLNIERTMTDSTAKNALSAVRFKMGQRTRMDVSELVNRISAIMPQLKRYAEDHARDMNVMSNVLAVGKWENISAVYQLLKEKHEEVLEQKNTAQLGAARSWKSASQTHRLLTSV